MGRSSSRDKGESLYYDKLLSEDERDHREYVVIYKQLVSPNENNNIANTLAKVHGLLSFSKNIFASRAVGETFLYFCLKGASTALTLQAELSIPEATAYRALKRLRSLGVITPAIKASKTKDSKGGPRPTVWALLDTPAEKVSEALNLHYRMLSPKFMVARELAQTILEEYIAPRQVMEITYREIVIRVKELKIPFRSSDVANLAAQYLHEQGIKVWR